MDNASDIRPSHGVVYRCINRETGKIEFESKSRIQARNEQNMLWSRGVKVDFVEINA